MKMIYKYPVPVDNNIFELGLHEGSEALCVQTQNGEPQIWVLEDPSNLYESHIFLSIGTGVMWPMDIENHRYIGTYQYRDTYVFHIFEVTSK